MLDFHIAPELPLQILAACITQRISSRRIGLHEHPFFQLEVITAGRLIAEFDGKKHEVNSGMAEFYRPFQSHGLQVERSDCVSNILVKFEARPSWVPILNLAPLQRFHHVRHLKAIVQRWLAPEPPEKTKAQLDFARLLLDISADVRYKQRAAGALIPGQRANWMFEVLHYIEQHATGGVTIPELASHFHMSGDHFTRRFRERMGVAPMSYLQRLKCEKAKGFLLEGRSCKEVAACLGFHSLAYFSRSFRRQTGISPSRWLAGIHEGL